MQQLPHFLHGGLHGHEIPLVGTRLILAARGFPAHPDRPGTVEMGFWWWDDHLGRWACFTAITDGGPLPTPRLIQAPAEQVNQGRSFWGWGPPAPHRLQHPQTRTGPVIPDNASDYTSNGDEVLSSGTGPTDIGTDAMGTTPPDGNYSDSDLE